MHKKPGYILFLLFVILATCMTLITLFMARSNAYQQLMYILYKKNQTNQLALSAISLGQSLLYVVPENNNDKKNTPSAKDSTTKQTESKVAKENKDDKKNEGYDQKLLKKIFSSFNNNSTYKLDQKIDGINAEIQFCLMSELGKLNINSVYDFANKKFINEGKENDKKKFCEWMFKQISSLTKQPSLFEPFAQHLKKREVDFNDVTELLTIKEFSTVFNQQIFYNPQSKNKNIIYLTDLFTTTTESEKINPWFFSPSWQKILNLKQKEKFSKEEQEKIIKSFKTTTNWEQNWNNSLRLLYDKEYKDLTQEIKSMLTTDCEANIFSLLLNATIGETTSIIFTILKKQTKDETATFDIIKVYQV